MQFYIAPYMSSEVVIVVYDLCINCTEWCCLLFQFKTAHLTVLIYAEWIPVEERHVTVHRDTDSVVMELHV